MKRMTMRLIAILAHVVVMQHVTKEKIDIFINALKNDATSLQSVRATSTDNTSGVRKYMNNGQIHIQNGNTHYNTKGIRTK